MPRPAPFLPPHLKTACVVLQIVPLPGLGAIIAGARNPHTRLMGRGIAQAVLVVFGSWPLIIPGAAGLLWAIWDATRIARAEPPPPWSAPAPDAEPATLVGSERAALRTARREARQAARQQRRAARQDEDDETRWMP